MLELNPNPLLIYLLLILGLFCSPIKSLKFELESGRTKCIAEDIKSNSMTVGKYSVVNPNEAQPITDSHKITVRVGKKTKKNRKVQTSQYPLLNFVALDKVHTVS